MSDAEEVALLVMVTGNIAVAPTSTVLKSSVPELREIVDGLDKPVRDAKSREVFAFEEISIAPGRTLRPLSG